LNLKDTWSSTKNKGPAPSATSGGGIGIAAAKSDDIQDLMTPSHSKRGKGKKRKRIPEKISRLLGQAHVEYMLGQQDSAIEIFRNVIKEMPHLPDPYHTIGAIYEEKGDEEKALQFYMIAAQMTQHDQHLWNHVVNMAEKQGDDERAFYALQRMTRAKRDDADAMRRKAVLLSRTKKHLNAAKTCLQFVDAMRAPLVSSGEGGEGLRQQQRRPYTFEIVEFSIRAFQELRCGKEAKNAKSYDKAEQTLEAAASEAYLFVKGLNDTSPPSLLASLRGGQNTVTDLAAKRADVAANLVLLEQMLARLCDSYLGSENHAKLTMEIDRFHALFTTFHERETASQPVVSSAVTTGTATVARDSSNARIPYSLPLDITTKYGIAKMMAGDLKSADRCFAHLHSASTSGTNADFSQIETLLLKVADAYVGLGMPSKSASTLEHILHTFYKSAGNDEIVGKKQGAACTAAMEQIFQIPPPPPSSPKPATLASKDNDSVGVNSSDGKDEAATSSGPQAEKAAAGDSDRLSSPPVPGEVGGEADDSSDDESDGDDDDATTTATTEAAPTVGGNRELILSKLKRCMREIRHQERQGRKPGAAIPLHLPSGPVGFSARAQSGTRRRKRKLQGADDENASGNSDPAKIKLRTLKEKARSQYDQKNFSVYLCCVIPVIEVALLQAGFTRKSVKKEPSVTRNVQILPGNSSATLPDAECVQFLAKKNKEPHTIDFQHVDLAYDYRSDVAKTSRTCASRARSSTISYVWGDEDFFDLLINVHHVLVSQQHYRASAVLLYSALEAKLVSAGENTTHVQSVLFRLAREQGFLDLALTVGRSRLMLAPLVWYPSPYGNCMSTVHTCADRLSCTSSAHMHFYR
jgi:tetratricopeptide (TPR) repeat protein